MAALYAKILASCVQIFENDEMSGRWYVTPLTWVALLSRMSGGVEVDCEVLVRAVIISLININLYKIIYSRD